MQGLKLQATQEGPLLAQETQAEALAALRAASSSQQLTAQLMLRDTWEGMALRLGLGHSMLRSRALIFREVRVTVCVCVCPGGGAARGPPG